MSAQSLTLGDGANVALHLDPAAGKISLTYAPGAEAIAFSAALKTASPSNQDALANLCRMHADGARPPAATIQLSQLSPRAALGARIVGQRLRTLLEWLLASKENTNFTYDLTPLNMAHLASAVSIVTSRPLDEIQAYLAEPGQDAALKAHYHAAISTLKPELAALVDPVARWARRLGWYATVRALKPQCVIETGVDKGLGSVLLCAALKRNAADGRPGRYIGTDINPSAGYLLGGEYAAYGRIMVGDSLASLKTLHEPIDVFINDSDHSAAYEYAEYQAIAPLLHAGSIVIGDNAHATDKLVQFAQETERRFLFFKEEPAAHWYAGAGIGFAFR